jgi:hypothetical protein
MTLFYLLPGSTCSPETFPAATLKPRGFLRLTRSSLLFFICFITQACGGPNAASLLSRLR